MKTSEILDLDFREKENKEIIQKVLKRMPMFEKETDEVPFEKLEKMIGRICRKYKVRIHGIFPVYEPYEINLYKAEFLKQENFSLIKIIYAEELYELFAKSCIFLYSEIKKGRIELKRDED